MSSFSSRQHADVSLWCHLWNFGPIQEEKFSFDTKIVFVSKVSQRITRTYSLFLYHVGFYGWTWLRKKVVPYLFLSTHREWESFLCRFLQCCQQRLRPRWALFISNVLCLVNLLARTIFENICLPLFSIN